MVHLVNLVTTAMGARGLSLGLPLPAGNSLGWEK